MNRDVTGTYEIYTDIEGDHYKCYNASVFKNADNGNYLYRSKFGDWVIGTDLGKMRRGAKIRSLAVDDKQKFLVTCPCKVMLNTMSFFMQELMLRLTDGKGRLFVKRTRSDGLIVKPS